MSLGELLTLVAVVAGFVMQYLALVGRFVRLEERVRILWERCNPETTTKKKCSTEPS